MKGSSRQKYSSTLVEPIIRCIDVFYDQTEIVSYFVTILCILVIDACMIQHEIPSVDEQVIDVISTKELLNIIVSVARRFHDDYVRHCFLIVFSSVIRICLSFDVIQIHQHTHCY